MRKAEYNKYSHLFPRINDSLPLESLDTKCFLCMQEGEDFIGDEIIWGNGAKNPNFMIIGKDSAGLDEKEEIWQGSRCTKIPLTNKKTGAKFRIFLEKTGIDPFSVFITNVVKCNNGYDKYEEAYERPLMEIEKNKLYYKFSQGCKRYLEREILIVKPKAIITLGSGAKKILNRLSNKIKYLDLPGLEKREIMKSATPFIGEFTSGLQAEIFNLTGC